MFITFGHDTDRVLILHSLHDLRSGCYSLCLDGSLGEGETIQAPLQHQPLVASEGEPILGWGLLLGAAPSHDGEGSGRGGELPFFYYFLVMKFYSCMNTKNRNEKYHNLKNL